MSDAVAGALLTHVVSAAVCYIVMYARGHRPTLPLTLWMLFLPLFGQMTFCMLLSAERRPTVEGEWQVRRQEEHRQRIDPRHKAPVTVPVEEALLINDAKERRALMMNMLRADPRKYIGVLLIARFNEDTETAHYATATLLEMQNRIQLEIQRLQARVQSRPDDREAWQNYVTQLNDYCQSGLLEGQLLRHERLLLAGALRDALPRIPTISNYAVALRNALELNDAAEARRLAAYMRETWANEEASWFESMRVCVQTRDREGLHAILRDAAAAPVEWTAQGRDKLQYWTGRRE